MRRSDYLDGLRSAYLGEVAGAAFAQLFGARSVGAGERDICALIERLEIATARILAPLLPMMPDPDEFDDARQRGAAAAERLGDWPALIDYSAHQLTPYVETFSRLRDAAPAEDRPALDLLVTHEIALEDFGRASLTGLDAPAEPLRAALAAAERHLAAQG
ncbi:MAG: hypothetical protein V4618_01390 [Pseudomonadota bacterium]